MRVALDLSHVRLSSAGTARYARELVAALHRRGDVEVVTLGEGESLPRGTLRRYRAVLAMDLTWYPWRGSRAAQAQRADVYHVPLARGPLRRRSLSTVVTIHDLVPGQYRGWNRMYTMATLRRVAGMADRIIVPSNDSAGDVVRWLPGAQERVRVVHNGVAQRFFDTAPPAIDLRHAERQPPSYILFVGTPEPRKNLSRLVEAMRVLRAQHRDERLFVVGGEGWGGAPPQDPSVVFLGRVSDERLHQLYAGARCVVLPSLHEGFGLPAVEAMAVGTPVVVSRAGALPEVCGDAAIYVDPLDVQSIAQGMIEAIASAEVLRPRGRARARHFTWDRAAERLMGVYQELL